MYIGQQVQLGCHPHVCTPARMEYAPLEIIFPPLELALSPLGCAPLETVQPLTVCAPLKVGREGEFLVAALEVGENCAVFQVF